jgi:hypothetical protein
MMSQAVILASQADKSATSSELLRATQAMPQVAAKPSRDITRHEGNTAVVRFHCDSKNIPMQYLLPEHPDMERLLVTPMRGELTGKVYRVLSHGPMQCKIRDTTIQPVRKKMISSCLWTNL